MVGHCGGRGAVAQPLNRNGADLSPYGRAASERLADAEIGGSPRVVLWRAVAVAGAIPELVGAVEQVEYDKAHVQLTKSARMEGMAGR